MLESIHYKKEIRKYYLEGINLTVKILLTEIRMDIAFIAIKTALFDVFRASSKVTESFSRSASVSTAASQKKNK